MKSRQGRSGRNRGVRALLGAVLALAVLPGYGGKTVVQGQARIIWSAEMIVGDDCQWSEQNGGDCRWGVSWNGWTNDYEQWGSASNDQFTYGHPLRVKGVWRNAALDDVFFLLNSALPNYDGMTLTVGSIDLALSDAYARNGCGASFKWPGVGAVQWNRGDTIPVRLTATDPAPSYPDMAVSFMKANYEATEGGSPAQVELQLAGNPKHSVYVPIDVEKYGGAEFDDFVLMDGGNYLESGVSFAEGENRKTITVMAEDDDDDDDQESVALSIGSIDCGVMADNPATAMVSLVDNDGVNNNGGDGNNGDGNSGDGNSGDGNSGDGNSGDGNGGDGNSGDGNSGDGNSGDGNGGDGNGGDGNSGGGNSGGGNSGGGNSGGGNSGGGNTGGGNTGGGNTGGGNTGGGNTGGGNTGGGNTGGGNTGGGNTGGGNNGGGGGGNSGGGNTGGGDGDRTGRDTPPPLMVAFGADSHKVLEGREVSVTVRLLNTDFTESVTIPILTTNGDGITKDDYSGVPKSLVFTPGQVTQSFRFVANKDELYEYDEKVILDFGTLPSGLTGGNPISTTITIQDLFGEPIVTIGNAAAYERRSEMTFSVRLSLPSAEPVTVRWKTQDGEAIAGEDYESAGGIASFPPGVTEPVIVRVPIIDDERSEPNETFTLVMSDPQNVRAGPAATGEIIDDDRREVLITPQNLVIQEGQTGSYSVVLGSAPTEPVTVAMSMAGETELLLNPATLVFNAADWHTERTVTVGAPDDDDALVAEPVTVAHSVSGGDYDGSSAPSVSVTIAETDLARVSIGDALAYEGDGEIVFVAELDMPTNRVVEVGWRTRGRSAREGDDYVGGRGRLTFPPMETRVEIPVRILDDGMDEPAESFDLTLTTATNAELGDATATGMIADDDQASVSIVAAASQVTEGESARFTLTRVGDLTRPLSVPVEINQTGEVLEPAPPEAATFAVGSATTILRVETLDDELDEPDGRIEVEVLLGDDHAVSAQSSAAMTVKDNDLPSVSIVAVVDRVTEGDEVRFNVMRVGNLEVPLEVPVEVGQVGDVLAETPPVAAIFADGSATTTLSITTRDDQLDEADALVEARLLPGDGHVVASEGNAAVTVADNDLPSVSIVAIEEQVTEGDEVRFNLIRVGDLTVTLDVPVAVNQIGDVLEGVPPTSVSFETGADSTVLVIKTQDDELDEPDGLVEVTIVDGSSHSVSQQNGDAVRVIDNDLQSVSIAANVARVGEGEELGFTLTRVGQLDSPLEVALEVGQTGDVLSGTPPTSATFSIGSATAVVRIETQDDQLDEPDALVEVRILPGDDHVVSAESSAVVTVTDDDLPSVSIVAAQDQVTEGDDVRFNVVRLGDLSVVLEVPVEVRQTGNVLSGAPPTSVSFEIGADTAVLLVETDDDQLDEEDGTVAVTLAEGGGYIMNGQDDATVTVADNDAAPTVTVFSTQALERAGEIVFNVSLGAPSGRTISVGWATSEGTATAGDDYASDAGTLMIAPGRMADTIRIPIVDDLLDEESETFSVALDALVNVLPGTVTATGTILDDDLPVAKAWLSRFGRTVATQVVDAVSERVYRDYGPGGGFVLGGANHADAGWADLITGSSFRYSTIGQAAPGGTPRGWTVWGRGASTRFSGEETEMSLNGAVTSGFVGVDYQQDRFLAGLLLSHSRGDGDYSGRHIDFDGQRISLGQGDLGSSLTGVHPYLRVRVTDRIATWGLLGRGWGNMTVSEGGHDTGIGMNLGAVGARGMILSPSASGGFGLALKSDAFYTGLNSERSAGGLPAEDVSVNRVRLAMEGSRDMVVGGGARVGLSVEAGVRRDGGDAETGTGVEMGGRVRYANPQHGLSVEATARGLIAHQNADYDEWGFAGSLLFDPGRAERGFSMRMRTAWGSVFGGVDQLWSQQSVRGLSRGGLRGGNEPEVNAELNYGLATRSDETLLTPYANIALAGGQAAAYRLGWRVKVGPTFRLSLENTIGGDPNRGSMANGLQLRGSFRREQ